MQPFGIRCIIAPSYADIFYNNCFKNGILPIILDQENVDLLMEDAKSGSNAVFTIEVNGGESLGGLTQDVVLVQPRTADNNTLDDLVVDLNDVFAIPDIGLDDVLVAEATTAGKIQFRALNPADSLKIVFGAGNANVETPTEGDSGTEVDEIQEVTINANGGTFTLSYLDPATGILKTTDSVIGDDGQTPLPQLRFQDAVRIP